MGDDMRLVDADALLSKMEKYNDLSARYRNEYLSGMQQRLETCIELVEDAPTVDAVPVRHGRWIYHIDDLFPAESTQECDQCHEEQPLTCGDNFCPNCGAKMTGKDGDGNG